MQQLSGQKGKTWKLKQLEVPSLYFRGRTISKNRILKVQWLSIRFLFHPKFIVHQHFIINFSWKQHLESWRSLKREALKGRGGEGLRLRCSANSQAKDRKKMIKANHENISEVIIKHEKTLLYSSLQSMYCSDKFSAWYSLEMKDATMIAFYIKKTPLLSWQRNFCILFVQLSRAENL